MSKKKIELTPHQQHAFNRIGKTIDVDIIMRTKNTLFF